MEIRQCSAYACQPVTCKLKRTLVAILPSNLERKYSSHHRRFRYQISGLGESKLANFREKVLNKAEKTQSTLIGPAV